MIRKEFDSEDIQQVKSECNPVATSTIRNVISKRMIKAGLRKLEHDVDKTHRKKIPIDHGFRMFFTSQVVKSKLQPEYRWLLEGHSLPKNDDSYVRVKEELHDEYLKAVPFLTINQENILNEKVLELTEEKNEIVIKELEHKKTVNMLVEENKKLQEKEKQRENEISILERRQREMSESITSLSHSIEFYNRKLNIPTEYFINPREYPEAYSLLSEQGEEREARERRKKEELEKFEREHPEEYLRLREQYRKEYMKECPECKIVGWNYDIRCGNCNYDRYPDENLE